MRVPYEALEELRGGALRRIPASKHVEEPRALARGGATH
jgi:hypothetical protein